MNELFMMELDSHVSMSFLEYTKGSMDINIVINLTDNEIDGLHYFAPEVDALSPASKEDNIKPPVKMVRREIPTGYKRLVKVFSSFYRHLRDEGVEIFMNGLI